MGPGIECTVVEESMTVDTDKEPFSNGDVEIGPYYRGRYCRSIKARS